MPELSFSASLYTEAALRATCDAYESVVRTELAAEPGGFTLRFPANCEESILDQFANHALYQTIITRAEGNEGQ